MVRQRDEVDGPIKGHHTTEEDAHDSIVGHGSSSVNRRRSNGSLYVEGLRMLLSGQHKCNIDVCLICEGEKQIFYRQKCRAANFTVLRISDSTKSCKNSAVT